MLASELSALLAQRCEDVVRDLLPNGTKKSGEWCAGSIHGEKGESLKVRLNGGKSGVWADFATGQSGDLLDLWASTKNMSIVQAMKEAADYLGLSDKILPTEKKTKKTFTKPPNNHLQPLNSMSPVHKYLVDKRCLQESVISLYGIPQSNDEIVFNYLRDGELILVKKMRLERKDGKKQIFASANSEPCLFGWHVIPDNAREVIICEGEIDAMSFHQLGFPALSVPFGGGRGDKQQWLDYEIDRLNRFNEIFICMDNDDSGLEGAREIIGRIGTHRCRVIELPMKDANECLVNGMTKEDIKYYVDNAIILKPEQLRLGEDFTLSTHEFMNPTEGAFIGYELGWNNCEEAILFKPSGLTMWTGWNGHGKTMFLSHAMLNMINQGANVCVASMELTPEELMARMYRQATAMEKPSLDYMKAINKWMGSRLWIFNLTGTANVDLMLDVFLYARRRYGVDVFIIDSLTTLSIAEDDFNGQKEFVERLRDFKQKYNCHVHLVAHPRKPRDESEIPGKYDIRGGGAISDLADNCFSVWRNKKKESILRQQVKGIFLDPDELEILNQPDARLRCDKNRQGKGLFKEGVFAFWYHEPSNQYRDKESARPRPYIDYSCTTKD